MPRRTSGLGAVPTLLSAPMMVGTAALLLATAGTMTVAAADRTTAATTVDRSPTRASFVGTTAIADAGLLAEVLDGREAVVSRDSQRQALDDAAEQDLQAAAEQQAKERNAALAQLAASAEKQAGLIAKDTWQLPVAGYRLTARFGQCSTLWSRCHTGLDFAAPSGTPIKAVASGTVTETGYAGAYGNRTIMTLADGTEIWYCHQTSYSVQAAQQVVAGQVIGTVGSTGNSTGAHLHLEVRPGAGDPVDPVQALQAHGLAP